MGKLPIGEYICDRMTDLLLHPPSIQCAKDVPRRPSVRDYRHVVGSLRVEETRRLHNQYDWKEARLLLLLHRADPRDSSCFHTRHTPRRLAAVQPSDECNQRRRRTLPDDPFRYNSFDFRARACYFIAAEARRSRPRTRYAARYRKSVKVMAYSWT